MGKNQMLLRCMNTSLLVALALVVGALTFESTAAFGRAGGGRSMGRGSSFGGSRRSAPPPMQHVSPPQNAPGAAPARQPAPPPQQSAPSGGGFMRSMAGGIAGGFLGSMLFNSLGHGAGMSGSGMGGSGPGLFDLLLLGAIVFFGFRWWKSRQQSVMTPSYGSGLPMSSPIIYDEPSSAGLGQPLVPASLKVESDLDTETAGDIFFRIQGAWTRRDLSIVAGILEEELMNTLSLDVTRLREERHINRLENISIRTIELRDAWTELGADLATMRIVANLLDYTIEEGSEKIVEGSDSIPVKFQEDWTFRRNNGTAVWKLAGIAQV